GGYWLVAADGGVFAFGDAGFFGSTGSLVLNSPIVGMAATSSGGGYWLVAADGGVFAFGDAGFFGSTGSLVLNSPIVGMAATSSGDGYWMAAADGGVFAFGDAGFLGSAAEVDLDRPVVGFGTDGAEGYTMVTGDGVVIGFSEAASSIATAECRPEPVSGFAANAGGPGWWITTTPLPVPRTVPSAASSPADSATVDELLSYAQACQGDVVEPAFGSLSSPVPGARRSSSFGSRVHPIWGVRQLHAGIDAAAPTGTPVLAATDGEVVQVAAGMTAYGRLVVVDHGDRVATAYAHLSAVDVEVGDAVTRGQQLGRVGSTGFATGPHLHFELRFDGVPVDPRRYLDATFVSAPA
ncbi:MAG: M23 family metallopeptidase, partial [Actinomycetota bacterium]